MSHSPIHTPDTSHQALMGYHELLGMHVVEWQQNLAVVELTIEPKHLNRSGNVHGGVLASMLDSALSLAGLHCEVPVLLGKACCGQRVRCAAVGRKPI